MTETKQKYYIAVPNEFKYSYQSFPTWKNYSFTGTLIEAQEKAIELFVKAGYLDCNMLINLSEHYLDNFPLGDEKYLDNLEENWDKFTIDEKRKHLKNFYDDYLEFYIDDYNKGLTLWKNVSDEDKRNVFSDNLNVIELN